MANSFVRYTGNNSTTSYSIPFSYRATSDLTVTLSGVVTTSYTLNSAGTTLTFTTTPAQDVAIEIRRRTSQGTKLVDYASGSVLTENDLDTDSDQAFFMSQEAIDDAGDVIKISSTDFQYDATNKQIRNVANPTSAQDVATKDYLENTFLTSANKSALTTVNANIANINAVNSNASNINSAVANQANINTVATNIGSVNTVATDIAKVIAVANDLAEAVSEVETVADDLNEATSEIDTVATNITNVNTVGTNIANVNTVAGISSNVTTVAGNNANVSTVAGISGNVTTVAGISSNVTSVANDATDIGTVATNITNVNNVATDIANVNSVAGNSTNINAVAGNATNINAVNANSSNINTVAGINADVTTVANDGTDIGTVATNIANVNTVAGNNTNINAVAGNNSNISTVAGVSSNVTTVAGISSDVTAVAGDATDIGTVATNLTGTNTIGTVAGSIANVNNVGGSIANVNTVATNLASVNNFGEVYRISATAPITSLNSGDLYFDTSTNILNVYGASGWQNAGSSVNGTSQRYNYTATNAQTTFTGADNNGNTLAYDAGYVDVYLNGVKLLNATDVTVTSGSSVVLASGATTGDIVDIVAYGTFSVASLNADNLDSGTVPSARISGAYTGITQTGTLTSFASTGIDDNATSTAITIDSSNRVGIGTASPEVSLHIKSNSGIRAERFANSAGSANLDLNKSRNATIGSHTILQNGDGIGAIIFRGSDGTNYENAAAISAEVDGTPGTNDMPGRLTFSTTPDGANAYTERMRITSAGNVGIGTSSPSEKLEVSGNILIANNNALKINDTSSAKEILKVDNLNQTILKNANDTRDIIVRNASDVDIVRFRPNGGIAIGGSGDANTLDDYEEGDWTPGYVAGSGTPVYSVRAGSYTKVGRQVTVTGAVSGARGSISGDIKINGLPFTCGSASKFSNSVSLLGANWSSVFSFKGKVNENDTTLSLYKEDTDNTSFVGVSQADMRTSSASENYVQFTITYFTA